MSPHVDYSLYLVTDSTPAILGDRDLVEVVDKALQGGVTIVQYRDKTSDTGLLINTAKALHQTCLNHNVPLLINDRVDVAVAVGCEGVHLGQDDMTIQEARQILGPDKIIGATVSSVAEAQVAVDQGADYLGIGTLYATQTKKNTKSIIGINGIRRILYFLERHDEASMRIKTVCIGGINARNLQRVVFQLQAPSTPQVPKTIDGVAIVSAIMGSPSPDETSRHLLTLLKSTPTFNKKTDQLAFQHGDARDEESHIRQRTLKHVQHLHETSPINHNMTNLVVQNFAASVALAIGSSPIMSNNGLEAVDLARLGGSLVINMGTATPESLQNHQRAIEAYNAFGGPVVLDPVGAGATQARREALADLMACGYFDLIKGNEREIMAVAQASGFVLEDGTQQRGVDSGSSVFSLEQRAYLVQSIARRERNVVLMTGSTDVISDGTRTYNIANGHRFLGMVTGSGCTLGTTIAAYMAANPVDKLLAAVAGMLHYEIAAERAAERGDVKGPGTFIPAFIDELWRCRMQVVEGYKKGEWLDEMKIGVLKHVPDARLLKILE